MGIDEQDECPHLEGCCTDCRDEGIATFGDPYDHLCCNHLDEVDNGD